MNKIKLINPIYKVEVFKNEKTGCFYTNDGDDYFIKTNENGAIHIFSLLNDVYFKEFQIVEVANCKKIPKDLFIYYYNVETLMKSYYEGNKSGLGSDSQITFNKFLENI